MAYNPNFRGSVAKASSRANASGYQNGTLSTMAIGTPVSADTTGKMVVADPSSESSILAFLGITSTLTPSSANGTVVSNGRLENVTLPGFSLGDPVYLGKNGTLINAKPDIGVSSFVAGDFVVFLGVVVKNEFNPSNTDIQLMIEIIGQL